MPQLENKESEFIKRFDEEIPILHSLGKYFVELITKKICDNYNINSLVKIPIEYRVKDKSSLVTKAFYRKKKYQNPYEDITDKVGLRIVLMSLNQISLIEELLYELDLFYYSKDRDFEQEIEENPTTFIYQSVHYIARNREDITYNGNIIKANTPCEIQIRTLLQHAYSELTHDTIYKPKISQEPKTHRKIARSMALIESTDDIFQSVINIMIEKEKNFACVKRIINEIMKDNIDLNNDEKLLNFMIDTYYSIIDKINVSEMNQYYSDHRFIFDKINEKKEIKYLFSSSTIILIYYLVYKRPTDTLKYWPFESKLLFPIYSDLGKAVPEL